MIAKMTNLNFALYISTILLSFVAGVYFDSILREPYDIEKYYQVECLETNKTICRDVTIFKTRFKEISKDGVYTITGDTNYVVHEKQIQK